MNKKLLCAALLSGLGVAQVASAQQFDDRWYLTGSTGFNMQDGDRGTQNAMFGAIGVGKFLSPNWSLDGELNYQNPHFEGTNNIVNPLPGNRGQNLNWSQYGVSLDLRYHFVSEGRNWNRTSRRSGYQNSEEESTPIRIRTRGEREDGNLAAKFGGGLQGDMGRVGVRAELAYRADFDDSSVSAPDEDWFGDLLASVGIIVPLGPEPTAPVAPAPVAPSCADSDSDGDGVNDCDDKCPGSQAGQTIGPDGCPVPVSIDLKGVNFDFDKSTLRPDAVAILNEAIEILKRYPELKSSRRHTTRSVPRLQQGSVQRRASRCTLPGINASMLPSSPARTALIKAKTVRKAAEQQPKKYTINPASRCHGKPPYPPRAERP